MEQFINDHPITTFLCFIIAATALVRIIRGYPKADEND